MQWLNEPERWNSVEKDELTMQVEHDTDFWRVTRHDFIKDDGHFYYRELSGDFRVRVKVTGQYSALYDQAGLMLRADEKTWMKCGIEFVEGKQFVSAVITRDFSDWSVIPMETAPSAIYLQVERIHTAIEFSYSLDGTHYQMAREAYLSDAPALQAGMMAAAPKGDGFEVHFEDFVIHQMMDG